MKKSSQLKSSGALWIVLSLLLPLLVIHARKPVEIQQFNDPVPIDAQSPCNNLMDLRSVPSISTYPPLGPVRYRTDHGYGVYRTEADATLSIDSSEQANILKIGFDFPRSNRVEDWISVKRSFSRTIDLKQCQGLEVTYRVWKRADSTTLRLTWCDRRRADLPDELWWHDFKSNTLRGDTTWRTVRIPFVDFQICYGDGCRIENQHRNMEAFLGFEINFISRKQNRAQGELWINEIRTY